MSRLRPLNDLVVVKLDEPPKMDGSIILPRPEDSPVRTGTVIAVGPGRRKLKRAGESKTVFTSTQVKPGERIVFFAAAAGTAKDRLPTYALEDGEALMHEEDILFTFEGDPKIEL
jgi:co-chaperonin GroES (HSP10)